MNPDRLAELEDERRFLLRSLTDLEREFVAGDVDEHDFAVLRDGYTARAATVLRAIDEGRTAVPRRPIDRRAVVLTVLGVLAVAVLSGWLLARSSGQRLAGQTMTGGAAVDDVAALLAEARTNLAVDRAAAARAYQRVTELDPSNSEARTYTSWILVLESGQQPEQTANVMLDAAFTGFEQVTAADPGYADAHCLYAVAAGYVIAEPDRALARRELQQCLDSDPPQEMVGLVEQFLADLTDPGDDPEGGAP